MARRGIERNDVVIGPFLQILVLISDVLMDCVPPVGGDILIPFHLYRKSKMIIHITPGRNQ
jgi:hypothetical protein